MDQKLIDVLKLSVALEAATPPHLLTTSLCFVLQSISTDTGRPECLCCDKEGRSAGRVFARLLSEHSSLFPPWYVIGLKHTNSLRKGLKQKSLLCGCVGK